jgi:cobalamin synthase
MPYHPTQPRKNALSEPYAAFIKWLPALLFFVFSAVSANAALVALAAFVVLLLWCLRRFFGLHRFTSVVRAALPC